MPLVYAAEALVIAYFTDWIANIDKGLRKWGDLGLALTNGLFNPQARRDLQNIEGAKVSSDENSTLRIQAEEGVGLLDTALHEIGFGTNDDDAFLNKHLLPMLGVPEFIVKRISRTHIVYNHFNIPRPKI